jgi:NADPH:quinone reductase-like Zn-dependent oxidoreductase
MNASRIHLKGKSNARVLVLGGSGGFGTFLLQCLKLDGAAFVATTSTQKELCESLGADRVIDYTTTNWWEIEEFKEDKVWSERCICGCRCRISPLAF